MVGSSGHSTGPHLHFEVREPDWSVVEPFAGRCGASDTSWVDQGEYDSTPATTCPTLPACEPVATLACGDAWTGRNDDEGSTDNIAWYGCTEGTEEGNEMVFAFATDRDEPVRVSVTGLDADLDLFLMPGLACDGEACLASSAESNAVPEHMEFAATAGETYTLMVDGYGGNASAFTLAIDCEGALPASDDQDDTGEAGTDAPGKQPRAQATAGASDAGCGCSASPTPTLAPVLLLFLSRLAWRRRAGASRRAGADTPPAAAMPGRLPRAR